MFAVDAPAEAVEMVVGVAVDPARRWIHDMMYPSTAAQSDLSSAVAFSLAASFLSTAAAMAFSEK